MKKRILIFSTAYLPLLGGAEIAVKEITDRLPEFEFVMVTARMRKDLPARERMGNIDVYRIGKGNALDKIRLIVFGPAFARTLGSFAALWAIMASYAGFSALRYKKMYPAVPYLLTLQEGDSRRHIYARVWWCWPYFKQIFRRADLIQAISRYLGQWAKDMGTTCTITVIPNGVALDVFRPFVGRRKRLHIVTVSRLVKKNGIDTIIESLLFLPSGTTLSIIGTGEDGRHLRALARQLGVLARVSFLGMVPQERIPHILQTAEVFCRPSRSEGLGNAFLEAMAVGVPVVGTSVGGIPDFLRDGETGLFCRVNDPKDLALKIKRIFGNSLLAEHLSCSGLALVKERYHWNTIARQMKEIFNSLFELAL